MAATLLSPFWKTDLTTEYLSHVLTKYKVAPFALGDIVW
jgi:hypothetical protein